MNLTAHQALQKAIEAHKAGRFVEAERYYAAILKAQPKHPDANHNMGVLAVSVGNVEKALSFFKTALGINRSIAQYWLSYIDALIKLGKVAEAKAMFDQAQSIGAQGDGFAKLRGRLNVPSVDVKNEENKVAHNQSNILDQVKLDQALRLAKKKVKDGLNKEAKEIYQDILKKFPKNKKALNGIKILVRDTAANKSDIQEPPNRQYQSLVKLYTQGQHQAVLAQAAQLILEFPNSITLCNIIGAANKELGELDKAIEAYKKAISIKPNYADAYNNMGVALQEQMKLDNAIEAYNKAISIKPSFAEVYYNLGKALQDKGEPDTAIEAYNKAISIKPDYAEAYNNLGITLYDQGKLDNAIEAYNKAISIKPNYAEAYYNVGVGFKDQEKLDKAIEAYNKAIFIKPDYAEAYNNLGITLYDQGKLDNAIEAYSKAISIKPDYAEAYNNLGITLYDQGKLDNAIEAYSKAISIKPSFAEAYNNLGITLNGIFFNKPNRDLQKIIVSLLDQDRYTRPIDIAKAAISLVKVEPDLQKHLQLVDAYVIESPQDVISDLSAFPLLQKLMSVCPLPDLELEGLLTNLRRSILLNISSLKEVSSELLEFQSALALQCFTNEYIYNNTDGERKALRALEKTVKSAFKNNKQPSPQALLTIASYKALNQYDWCNLLVPSNSIQEVFTRQVEEPNEEKKLRQDLPILKEISDNVSSKVREQYEESPYPRWVKTSIPIKPISIKQLLSNLDFSLENGVNHFSENPQILIAGCGTGQHSIGTAKRFENSHVTAIDLSLSSLSYAKRKTIEHGINNIDYIQADILDLKTLGKNFDVVESVGVLHHMKNPMSGWKILVDCLKPGGLMKIGLYGEVERKHIVKARDIISNLKIGNSRKEMIAFREFIKTCKDPNLITLYNEADFYSTSNYQDLIFHVQEHRFTAPQLYRCIEDLNLIYLGFEYPNKKEKERGQIKCPEWMRGLNRNYSNELDFPNQAFWLQKPLISEN